MLVTFIVASHPAIIFEENNQVLSREYSKLQFLKKMQENMWKALVLLILQ